MANVDVTQTAENIDAMARRAEEAAKELRRIAEKMRDKQDLNYTSEALGVATNLLQLFRLDLLITRPLRALGL